MPSPGLRERLGHEARVHAALVGNLLDDEADCHHGVGHGQGVGVAEVDLVLARRIFVLGVLNRDAHVFEGEHGALAQIGGQVRHCELEVRSRVERLRRLARFARREVEVLDLRGA